MREKRSNGNNKVKGQWTVRVMERESAVLIGLFFRDILNPESSQSYNTKRNMNELKQPPGPSGPTLAVNVKLSPVRDSSAPPQPSSARPQLFLTSVH